MPYFPHTKLNSDYTVVFDEINLEKFIFLKLDNFVYSFKIGEWWIVPKEGKPTPSSSFLEPDDIIHYILYLAPPFGTLEGQCAIKDIYDYILGLLEGKTEDRITLNILQRNFEKKHK